MEGFFDECHDSLCQIMEALATGLGLAPRSLAAMHSSKNHELRLLCYPEADARLLDGSRLRIAEHTDFGSVTLLFQDNIGGLEIETQAGVVERSNARQFRAVTDATPVMIVNIGDSLERWTNSTLRAVVHRVSKPGLQRAKEAASGGDVDFDTMLPKRQSIAFFAKPNRDISLLPLPHFVRDRTALWKEDMTAHAYNQSKLVRTF